MGVLAWLGPTPIGKPTDASQFYNLQEEETEWEHDDAMEWVLTMKWHLHPGQPIHDLHLKK